MRQRLQSKQVWLRKVKKSITLWTFWRSWRVWEKAPKKDPLLPHSSGDGAQPMWHKAGFTQRDARRERMEWMKRRPVRSSLTEPKITPNQKKKRICEIFWSEIVRSLLGFCYKKYPFLNVIIVTLMMCSNRGFIRSCICRGGSTPQKSKGQREPDGKTSAADPQICMLGIILQLKDISRD